MSRIFDIREPSLAALRDAPVYFRYGSNKRRVLIDRLTADAVLICYNALEKQENRDKFERMISHSFNRFQRLVNFCWKHVRIGG